MQWLQLMPGRAAGSRRRLGDRRGAVAMIFAVSVVPLAMAVGLASDYSVYVKVQSQLNLAADTAAMQAVRVASEVSDTNADGTTKSASAYQSDVQAAGQQAGQQWFQAQMGNLVNGSVPASNIAVNVVYNATGTNRFSANVAYTGTVPTNFGALFHVANFNIGGASSTVISNTFVEVLMLLDNSGSMLIPSTSAGIAQMESATPCSTKGLSQGGRGMTDSRGAGYWWNWDYTGNYGYNYGSNSPPPASPINGNCDPAYTGNNAACTYAPAMQNISSSNTWYCTNQGGYKYTSSSGQTYYRVQAPCAFACHSDSSGNGDDFYSLARNAGIELRTDVVQSAAANVIQALSNKHQPNQFSVGVYAFNNTLSAVWPTSGEATTDLTTTQSKTKAMTTPVTVSKPAPIGNTDFKASMQSLSQNVTSAGNGTTPTTPLKNLFIVTDGINNPNYDSAIDAMNAASNESCSQFWAKGFNVYVLYTPYLPLPSGKYQTVVMPYSEPAQTGATAANVAALQACARYPSHFFQATNPTAINTAMQTMLASALNSPGRVSN